MDKKASPKADKTPQTSPEAAFTTFIQLNGRSTVQSNEQEGKHASHKAPSDFR